MSLKNFRVVNFPLPTQNKQDERQAKVITVLLTRHICLTVIEI